MTPYQKLYAYALRLLGRRWYSIAEMEKKLKTRQNIWKIGVPEDYVAVIEKLKELKFLNDRYFAQFFSESLLRRKPQGKRLLNLKMKQKGLAADLISETLEKQNIDEFAFALLAGQKKLLTLHNSDKQKQRAKVYRFLLSRGFSHHIGMEVLGKIIS